jgi:hypothetical protein
MRLRAIDEAHARSDRHLPNLAVLLVVVLVVVVLVVVNIYTSKCL